MNEYTEELIGEASYDLHEFGSEWWFERSQDLAHQRAYRRIAEYAAEKLKTPVHCIIDYACGAGFLMYYLAQVFPDAHIIGIDESEQAIAAAHTYLTMQLSEEQRQRISLECRALPNFELDLPPADLVVFSFPDFRTGSERSWMRRWKPHFAAEWQETLALRRRLDRMFPDLVLPDSQELFIKRIASRNMHALARSGAYSLRIEYAECQRQECHPMILEEMQWYEGADAHAQRLQTAKRQSFNFHAIMSSEYVQSKVMDDVYAQTGDESDRQGGFMMSLFQCLSHDM